MTGLQHTLIAAEERQEYLAALIRLFVFLALTLTTISLLKTGAHHHPVLNLTIAYGMLAATGLVFAWRKIFHPLLPFVFVTIEVVLVSGQLVFMGSLMGQSPAAVTALPFATVIFVILTHAAMRYRPWLIIYAAALFFLIVGIAIPLTAIPAPQMMMNHDTDHGLLQHQAFPIVMIALTAGVLFVTARGTRRLLFHSITEQLAHRNLSRFFAPDIAAQLTDSPADSETIGSEQFVAVLFTDIRSFSALSEQLSARELAEFLSEFRAILANIIQRHGGVVDKFIGDAVMAVFGFPDPNRLSAENCLACAEEMQRHIKQWSAHRVREGQPPISIGIGMHYGEAFVGVVGRDSLLEFTVIGDTVNIAERIERLTRTLNADIAASCEFADAAHLDWQGSDWSVSRNRTLDGHTRTIDVVYLSEEKAPR